MSPLAHYFLSMYLQNKRNIQKHDEFLLCSFVDDEVS